MQLIKFGVSRMDRRLMALEREIQSIGQLPAIICNGTVKLLDPDFLKLDESKLKEMAMFMGGELAYLKLRLTYTELEVALCGFKDCYRPAKDVWCEDHPNGKAKPSSTQSNVHPFINPRVS